MRGQQDLPEGRGAKAALERAGERSATSPRLTTNIQLTTFVYHIQLWDTFTWVQGHVQRALASSLKPWKRHSFVTRNEVLVKCLGPVCLTSTLTYFKASRAVRVSSARTAHKFAARARATSRAEGTRYSPDRIGIMASAGRQARSACCPRHSS